MTQTIHKQPLKLLDLQVLHIDAKAKVLCVQMQNGVPTLWYETAKAPMNTADLQVFMVGTGNNLPPGASDYIGTVQLEAEYDGLVFHVYTD